MSAKPFNARESSICMVDCLARLIVDSSVCLKSPEYVLLRVVWDLAALGYFQQTDALFHTQFAAADAVED